MCHWLLIACYTSGYDQCNAIAKQTCRPLSFVLWSATSYINVRDVQQGSTGNPLDQRGKTQKSEFEYGIALEDMTWVISGCC